MNAISHPLTVTLPREESMRVLREGNVSEALIAAAFGLTRQRVNKILGSNPDRKPLAVPYKPGDDYPDLPTYLKAWRARQRLSQQGAANMLHVSLKTYYAWENGRQGCTLPVILVKYLDLLEKTQPTRI